MRVEGLRMLLKSTGYGLRPRGVLGGSLVLSDKMVRIP